MHGLLVTVIPAKVCPEQVPQKFLWDGSSGHTTLCKGGLPRPTPLQGLIAALSRAHFGGNNSIHHHSANPTFALLQNRPCVKFSMACGRKRPALQTPPVELERGYENANVEFGKNDRLMLMARRECAGVLRGRAKRVDFL